MDDLILLVTKHVSMKHDHCQHFHLSNLGNEDSIVLLYILLLVFLVLLTLLGFLIMIIVLKERNIKR